MKKKRLCLTFDPDVLAEIHNRRWIIPTSAYVNTLLKEIFKLPQEALLNTILLNLKSDTKTKSIPEQNPSPKPEQLEVQLVKVEAKSEIIPARTDSMETNPVRINPSDFKKPEQSTTIKCPECGKHNICLNPDVKWRECSFCGFKIKKGNYIFV